jgi:hypothetical protein
LLKGILGKLLGLKAKILTLEDGTIVINEGGRQVAAPTVSTPIRSVCLN